MYQSVICLKKLFTSYRAQHRSMSFIGCPSFCSVESLWLRFSPTKIAHQGSLPYILDNWWQFYETSTQRVQTKTVFKWFLELQTSYTHIYLYILLIYIYILMIYIYYTDIYIYTQYICIYTYSIYIYILNIYIYIHTQYVYTHTHIYIYIYIINIYIYVYIYIR